MSNSKFIINPDKVDSLYTKAKGIYERHVNSMLSLAGKGSAQAASKKTIFNDLETAMFKVILPSSLLIVWGTLAVDTEFIKGVVDTKQFLPEGLSLKEWFLDHIASGSDVGNKARAAGLAGITGVLAGVSFSKVKEHTLRIFKPYSEAQSKELIKDFAFNYVDAVKSGESDIESYKAAWNTCKAKMEQLQVPRERRQEILSGISIATMPVAKKINEVEPQPLNQVPK